MESGRWIVNDSELTCVMIGYGPRFFLESFLEGQVNQKYLALTYTWLLTLKSDAVGTVLSLGAYVGLVVLILDSLP